MQPINYDPLCYSYGTIQHEMYHALGFYHEQSRTDRDDYVTILYDNIDLMYWPDFAKYEDDVITGFGEPYDYTSVMHYPRNAFSNNGEDTIITMYPAYQNIIGQRLFLSETDIAKLNKMYVC